MQRHFRRGNKVKKWKPVSGLILSAGCVGRRMTGARRRDRRFDSLYKAWIHCRFG
jgi:hypothetical protein